MWWLIIIFLCGLTYNIYNYAIIQQIFIEPFCVNLQDSIANNWTQDSLSNKDISFLDYISEKVQGYFKFQECTDQDSVSSLFSQPWLSSGYYLHSQAFFFFYPSRKIAILLYDSYLHITLSRVRKNFSPNQQRSGLQSYWTDLGHVPSLNQSLWVGNWVSTDWSKLFRVHS